VWVGDRAHRVATSRRYAASTAAEKRALAQFLRAGEGVEGLVLVVVGAVVIASISF
jgi:hypothetical protein